MSLLLLEGVDGVQELDLLVRPRVQHVTNLTIIVVIIINHHCNHHQCS